MLIKEELLMYLLASGNQFRLVSNEIWPYLVNTEA